MAKVNVDGCFDKFGGQGKEETLVKKHLSVCLTKSTSAYFCTRG